MLKTTAPSVFARHGYTKANENKVDTNGSSGIGSVKIDDRVVNLSSSTKVKKSSGIGFCTSEAI